MNIRERGYSVRYSNLLSETDKKGTVIADDVVTFLASPKKRKKEVCSFAIWGIINALLSAYLLTLVIWFWDLKKGCADALDNWLLMAFVTQICHLFRRFVLIINWIKAKDPAVQQTKLDICFLILVVLPELGVYIYGNCIIYGD